MQRRTARMAAALVAGVLALVLMPLAAPTSADPGTPPGSGRALVPFSLDMVEGGGILTLRDSEPYEIQNPTSISGTINAPDLEADPPEFGTGAISAGTFSTPLVSFQQEFAGLDVFIEAEFSQIAPENLTGTIDEDGNLFVAAALRVDLDIDVGRNPVIINATCVSSPINLTLSSVEPYDPETGLVALVNNNFSVPPVATGGGCESNVRDAINEQLAGSGHAISLTLQGELALPEAPREPTVTTLEVSPEGGARVGDAVALTASVESEGDTEPDVEPSGFVEFRDGTQVLDSVALETDGTAELVTESLSAGTRSLTARYRGDEVYAPSTSAAVEYTLLANPVLTWDAPASVQIAGDPVDFAVVASNTGFGGLLENARLDVTIRRPAASGPFGPVGGDPRITLAQVDNEGGATPVPLTFAGTGFNQNYSGSIGAGTGVPLEPGQSLTETLRLAVPPVGTPSPTACGAANVVCPAPLEITFTLQLVDPDTGDIDQMMAAETGQILMTESERRATTITAGTSFPPPGAPAIVPQTVRAGNVFTINNLVLGPALGSMRPTGGMLSFEVDGRPALARRPNTAASQGYSLQIPCCQTGNIAIQMPTDTTPGTRTITVRYSGDAFFKPVAVTFAVDVVPQVAPVYECQVPGLATFYVGRANLIAQGALPAVAAAGSQVKIGSPDLRFLVDRGPSTGTVSTGLLLDPVFSNFTGIGVSYNVEGEASASGVVRANATVMTGAGDPDQVWSFTGLQMSVVIDGEPGEVVPVAIEEIEFRYPGIGDRLRCEPVGEPVVLGHVTVAGTSLTVSPEGTARAGAPVVLTADTAPSAGGLVEFRDGTVTIGVTPVNSAGRAVLTTTLPEGESALTARYFGGLTIPSTTSPIVSLTVLPTVDCAAFAEEGNAAVIRLVYIELLNRCPDQAGFAYWLDRLNTGTSRAVFARTISNTPEAQGVLVDKAYAMMLERVPDGAGKAYWVGLLQGGYRYDRLLSALAGEPEFFELGGSTNDGFATRLYQRVLLRDPDQGGLDFWVSELEGGVPRWKVAQAFTYVDETLSRLAATAYQEILDRAPNATERGGAVTFLRNTGNLAALYGQLIDRQEFADRAQSYPNLNS